jgi:predicted transglutaminase-like cysteine proteinase
MGMANHRRWSVAGALLAGFVAAIGWGCAGSFSRLVGYDYFGAPDRNDPWSRKIEFWQVRARTERQGELVAAPAAVAGPGSADSEDAGVERLQAKYESYRRERKRAMARELAEWIQVQARQHYVPDGPVDQWATLDETLKGNGDDCDGLELLVFSFLRDLGFPENEVYRAIVYRRSDGQHHMVTLWFEDADDPWVIDPTGAMTSGMPRMSELRDWVPLKVFSHDEDFTVRSQRVARSDR